METDKTMFMNYEFLTSDEGKLNSGYLVF